MTGFIMIELEIKFPEQPPLTPREHSLLMTKFRQVASAGAVAALGAVLNNSSTVEAAPVERVLQ